VGKKKKKMVSLNSSTTKVSRSQGEDEEAASDLIAKQSRSSTRGGGRSKDQAGKPGQDGREPSKTRFGRVPLAKASDNQCHHLGKKAHYYKGEGSRKMLNIGAGDERITESSTSSTSRKSNKRKHRHRSEIGKKKKCALPADGRKATKRGPVCSQKPDRPQG